MHRSKTLGGIALASLMLVALTGCPSIIANIVGATESVQQAINSASAGDTIKILGSHTENVTIAKDGITLTSETGGSIDGDVTVDGNNVTISNLTITGKLDTVPGSFNNLTLDNVTVQGWNNAIVNGTFTCTRIVQPGGVIQDAVNASSSGDSICVAPGGYTETVDVNTTNVTLAAVPNAGKAGYATNRGKESTIEGQVLLTADGVALNGFDISPPPATSNATSEAVRIDHSADNVVVMNNVVRDFENQSAPEWEGIEGIVAFGGDASDAIENVTITRNLVTRISGRNFNGGAAGIFIQGNVQGAHVADNAINNIGLEKTDWAHGVDILDTGNHSVSPGNISVTDNDISNILSNPASSTFGVGVGVEAENGTTYDITGNDITDNELGVEVKHTETETAINRNNISDNSEYGVINQATGTVDATNNWWGATDGPSGQGPGSGDAVSDHVDFSDWATSAF